MGSCFSTDDEDGKKNNTGEKINDHSGKKNPLIADSSPSKIQAQQSHESQAGSEKSNAGDTTQAQTEEEADAEAQQQPPNDDNEIYADSRGLDASDDDEDEEKELQGKNHKRKQKQPQKDYNTFSAATAKNTNNRQQFENKNGSEKYIRPNADEASAEIEINLAHICHKGHFNHDSQFSAQNVLENDNSYYISSLKNNQNNHSNSEDWFIFKVLGTGDRTAFTKFTKLKVVKSDACDDTQCPREICVQFCITDQTVKHIVNGCQKNKRIEWSEYYATAPNPMMMTTTTDAENENENEFVIEYSESYLKQCTQLLSSVTDNDNDNDNGGGVQYEQYIRVSFWSAHGLNESIENNGKYALQNMSFFGVPLAESAGAGAGAYDSGGGGGGQSGAYKYVIQNNSESALCPKPGKGHARILMKDQIFFVRANEKIRNLKQTICDEYGMLMKGNEKFKINEILLFVDGYGMIDDKSDSSILNKTLSNVGVKTKQNYGYYILVVIT